MPHGGGLTGGQKETPEGLKDSGYIVEGMNYRLVPEASVANCIDDAAEAVAWTMKHAADYGDDLGKLFVAGHSAGGFLTSMVGLDKSRLAKYGVDTDSIAGLIPFSGQVITNFSDRKAQCIGELTPLVDRNASLFHVRKDAPPPTSLYCSLSQSSSPQHSFDCIAKSAQKYTALTLTDIMGQALISLTATTMALWLRRPSPSFAT